MVWTVVVAVYWFGFAAVFIFFALTLERREGRVLTGEADIPQAFILAALWPAVAVFVAVAICYAAKIDQEKKKKGGKD